MISPRTSRCLAATALVTVLAAACGSATGEPPGSGADSEPERGAVVSVEPIAELTAAQVAARLGEFGIDTSHVTHDVQALRVVYATVDPHGEPTTASGLVALPDGESSDPMRLVSWQHGTIGFRGAAASVSADGPDRAAALLFAAAGHVVSAPDYLGLGVGPGRHPYDHTESAVTASIDALRAVRSLPELDDRTIDPRVLMSGFSQGGPVTMALGHALQEGADPELGVGALAPVGGPYDFTGTLATATSGDMPNVTAYLGYLTVAWDRLHDLYDEPAEAFRAPYARTVESLFDGTHPTEEIMAGVPATLPELFTPEFLEQLRDPDGVLEDVLEEADTSCDWSPAVPVRLYHARGDRDVPMDNAEFCRTALAERDATVQVIDLGGVDHATSLAVALPQIAAQFARTP